MPGTETAGRHHAETTLPARSPVRNRGRERRETPGFQRLHRRTRRHPDWLAEGPVSSEPVSHPKFPVPRENTGNLAILAVRGAYGWGAKSAGDSAGFQGQFPTRANREFFRLIREEIRRIRVFGPGHQGKPGISRISAPLRSVDL